MLICNEGGCVCFGEHVSHSILLMYIGLYMAAVVVKYINILARVVKGGLE